MIFSEKSFFFRWKFILGVARNFKCPVIDQFLLKKLTNFLLEGQNPIPVKIGGSAP